MYIAFKGNFFAFSNDEHITVDTKTHFSAFIIQRVSYFSINLSSLAEQNFLDWFELNEKAQLDRAAEK